MLRVALVIDDYNELIYLQTLLKKLGFDVEGMQNQRKYADVSLGFNPHILVTTAKGKKVNGLVLAQGINKRRGMPKILALQSAGGLITSEEQEASGVDMVLDSPVNVKKLILAMASMGDLDEALLLEKYNKIITTMAAETEANTTFSEDNYEVDDNGQPIIPANKIKSEIESIVVSSKPKEKVSDSQHVSGRPVFPLKEAAGAAAPAVSARGVQPEHRQGSLDLLKSENPNSTNRTEDLAPADVDHANSINSATSSPIIPVQQSAEEKEQRDSRFEKWLHNMEPLVSKNFDRERILAFNKIIRNAIKVENIEDVEDERKKFVKALFKK